MYLRWVIKTAMLSLLAGFGIAVGQMPQPAPMPTPAPVPAPGQMPQPGQPGLHPGDAGQPPALPGNNGQQNGGRQNGGQQNGGQQNGGQQNGGQQNGGRDNGDQRSRYQNAGFIGGWCAQGDPTKQTSISYNGAFYNLTNENGDTSMGNLLGKNQIKASGWQFVTGTLSSNGRQIQWSNGTFWARCPTKNGGGGKLDLNGNWYPNGNRSMQCSIQQHRGNLQLQNESGQRATGSFNGKFNVTTNWQGTRINGTVSRDGNRINWDNGSYWIRYRLYTQ